LTKNHQLKIETSIQPRFSILPTKTEYAKWSLYAQLPPCPPHWVDDMSKGFSKMGIGKRYTMDKSISFTGFEEKKSELVLLGHRDAG
jgi:hypothetical protein